MRYCDFKRKDGRQILELDHQELPLLRYPLLEQTGVVEHAFTTRGGGVSRGIYESLNLSFTRGDDPEAVMENYRRLAHVFGKEPDAFVCSDQTHTTNVLRVDRSCAGYGVTRERPYTDVDGLITDEAGLILSTFYADCVPLFFVDPVHHAIGLSHSGWRGTVGRMGAVTLEAMEREFGSEPEQIFAAVGPSICQDCYEVSADVANAFCREFAGHEREIMLDKGNGKYQLDLWKCNEIVLLEAGIRREQLAVTNICTCCNSRLLFSHRASHGKRGNLGAFLMLREKS
ncbi:MAG: peptidoglycan editing factor PgeF [Agathobacter sp.]|nr:peptidoglycan editing factor PgeF [Agathobacter sp.]